MDVTDAMNLLVLNASSGLEAITQTFAYRKATDPEFSIGWLAKRLELKSRGSLSEMLRGKKAIPLRIRPALLSHLTRSEVLAEFIELMLDLEEDLLPADRTKAVDRLQTLRTYMTEKFVNIQLNDPLTLFASDVYTAFDLFAGKPHERQLIEYFGRERYHEVLSALRILLTNELVTVKDSVYARTDKIKPLLMLPDRTTPTVQEYLRESVRDAYDQVNHWSRDQKMACFGSTVISVRVADYIKVVEQLRKDVFKYFSALETKEGEMLIRFNMQVYPIKKA